MTDDLRRIGAHMATVMFNLAQGGSLPFGTRDLLRDLQRQWDEAVKASDRSPQQQTEGVDIPRFPVGTPVTKVLGYPFPGTVVSTFHTLSGQERFVVEATGEAYRGMLHIFNGDQLRATTEGQPVPRQHPERYDGID
ncbi:hypothetical protein SAMN02982989_3362 [Xaviernesmea oryzae]|uniref:Uncharacterized protein n=1 Tax=Xaviernesmea oryzae TaxID=464029 RepID=A0A1X7G7S5_9HYPH|nr:hypothetical protein [Xaviernesmea oryzae]SMF65462.1 hypothetical protein SAMN02982989_3362 [Xaviernesmea oryzae]